MCGIAGIVRIGNSGNAHLPTSLQVMNNLLRHRGPDGEGVWAQPDGAVGFGHRRLSILDLSEAGAQPMHSRSGNVIVHNGEVYNYRELQSRFAEWDFSSQTDTETILAAYEALGDQVGTALRGMFAFAIWDAKKQRLVAARDRFGIKPFYYYQSKDYLYFASEPKALLPFLPDIQTDPVALSEYLTFQYTISDRTLFSDVKQLMPGHMLVVSNGNVKVSRYWDISYDIDYSRSENYFVAELERLVDDSVSVHLRSDVPVGAYISGGVDSSLMGTLASRHDQKNRLGFHGRFLDYPGYDESGYAQAAADNANIDLQIIDITASDFEREIGKVIYHLDFPVAGPGSFPQYMVSQLAAKHLKVVLGGQGGDEIFGGYARYLIAYFEQCIKAAIDGTYRDGNFVVTIESIIPNLGLLREYKPLISQFWQEGLFGPLDSRYFRLINRSNDMRSEVQWDELPSEHPFEVFQSIFNNRNNVKKEAYFDSMTHFDFKSLLPALLHVEDRMSMAHGLESRVPLLDHEIVELTASIPADMKFSGGRMKHLLKNAYKDILPTEIIDRRDKMGFPVPLKEWFTTDVRPFVLDIFQNIKEKRRPYFNADVIMENIDNASRFSRKNWALLSLELWHQQFHDRAHEFKKMQTDLSYSKTFGSQ